MKFMQKLIGIILLTVICSSCSNNGNSTSPPPDTTPALPNEYNIQMLLGEDDQSNSKFTFPHTYTSKLYYTNRFKEEQYIGTTKELDYDERVFTYYQSEFRYTDNVKSQKGTHNSHFLTYQSEDYTELTFIAETDLVVWYSESHSADSSDVKEFTDEELKQIAEDFILKFVDKKKFESFEFDQISIDATERYAVRYTRLIEGLLTDESITVRIEKDGVVECYDARNLYQYDSLINHLPKRNLDAAMEYLQNQVNALKLKGLQYYPPTIVSNADGEIYLKQVVGFTDDDGKSASQLLFINVN